MQENSLCVCFVVNKKAAGDSSLAFFMQKLFLTCLWEYRKKKGSGKIT